MGGGDGRKIKRLQALVETVNTFEPEIEELSDAELRAKTEEFRRRVAPSEDVVDDDDDGGGGGKESLDDILPEAFAVVREAAKRTIGQRHFDVQLMGGMVLHGGDIAEMKTGEGKTLVSTLPAYLNSLGRK